MKVISVFIDIYGKSSAFLAPTSRLWGANLNFDNHHVKTS